MEVDEGVGGINGYVDSFVFVNGINGYSEDIN